MFRILLIVVSLSFEIFATQASALSLGRADVRGQGFEVRAEVVNLKNEKKLGHLTNKMITLHVTGNIKDRENEDLEFLEFDARMPEHNHGMIVKPKISKLSDYKWKIEGVKFHMKGKWELSYKFKAKNTTHDLKSEIVL